MVTSVVSNICHSDTPVTLGQALSYDKKINKSVLLFVILANNLIWNYYLPQFPEY